MNKKIKPDAIGLLLWLGRIFLGALFIYASWDKILYPAAFAGIIANYQILPPILVNPAALSLPWIELVCGVCLIINRWTGGSALIVTGLMAVFMVAFGYTAFQGIDIACGCFTTSGEPPDNMWGYLLRDALLLALAVTLLMHPKTRCSITQILNPGTKGS